MINYFQKACDNLRLDGLCALAKENDSLRAEIEGLRKERDLLIEDGRRLARYGEKVGLLDSLEQKIEGFINSCQRTDEGELIISEDDLRTLSAADRAREGK